MDYLKLQNNLRIGLVILFLCLGFLEILFPLKRSSKIKNKRWLANISLSIMNQIITKFIVPISLIQVANWSQNHQIGVLNLLEISINLKITLSLILFDLLIWLQHILFHKISFFWRFHRVHHMDTEFDVSTGIRFHPGEILFSYAYKALIVYFLGVPIESIILFEFILTIMSIFTHSNLNIPERGQVFLNLILITPNMHRIHHSNIYSEHNKNFGFNFSIWDKLFGTFLKSASFPQNKINIGLNEVNEDQGINLTRLLTSPFFTKKEVKRS